MTPSAFRAELERLELSDREAATFLDVDPRNIRRWAADDGDGPPRSVALTFGLMRLYQLDTAAALAVLTVR